MTNAMAMTAFLAIFQIFQANVEGNEANISETDTETSEIDDTVVPSQDQLSCEVNVTVDGFRKDIQVLATAGKSPVNEKLTFQLDLDGLNAQTMRRAVTVKLKPEETIVLARYSVTMKDNPQLTAALTFAEATFPCEVK